MYFDSRAFDVKINIDSIGLGLILKISDDNKNLRSAVTRIIKLAFEGEGLLAALQSGSAMVPSGRRQERVLQLPVQSGHDHHRSVSHEDLSSRQLEMADPNTEGKIPMDEALLPVGGGLLYLNLYAVEPMREIYPVQEFSLKMKSNSRKN